MVKQYALDCKKQMKLPQTDAAAPRDGFRSGALRE
jgi:hypothetical protein